ncbi:MAG: tyrosine-type recombinase/integrase [Erysipelotrichaceae bacterium]
MRNEELIRAQSQFIKEQRLNEKSKRTLSKYDRDIQKFLDFIPDDVEITKEHILEYKDHLCDGRYQTSSINNYLTILNTFLKWCGQGDLRVREIKTQQKSSISNVVSEADAKRLLRFAKQRGREDIYLIIKIILTTGIRINELEWFTVENLKSYHFSVKNKGKEREIILTQELTRELRKYCRERKLSTGKIFILSYSTIWRQMKIIAGAARVNLEKVHPHSFRHLFAKSFMAQYNNVLDLADILGHSSLETTRIYTRSTIEEKRDKLEGLRSPAKRKGK